MKCLRCNKDFPERDVQESHDVPCYLFIEELNRREKKQRADKYPRRWLCEECHEEYEYSLNLSLRIFAQQFGEDYFKNA